MPEVIDSSSAKRLAAEGASIGANLDQAGAVEHMVASGDLLARVVDQFEADRALDIMAIGQNHLGVHCRKRVVGRY